MSDVIKMIKDITVFEDLQKFANAQYSVMTAQAKKIEKLQEEVEKFKIEIEQANTKRIVSDSLDTSKNQSNDAETTCLVQLALLKSKAMEGELTLEETKKVEIYAKVLQLIKVKSSDDTEDKSKIETFDTKELLGMIGGIKLVESK